MKNTKVILAVAVVVFLGVGATFLLTSSSGLKGDFYSRSQGVKNITRDPMSRQYSSQITDDLNSKVNSRVNQKMDYKAFEIKYDANGFDDKMTDDHLVKRGEFLHAIVTVLNPPDIDSYTTKCDFTGTDLDNHWARRDFCYVIKKIMSVKNINNKDVVRTGSEDFIPNIHLEDLGKNIYSPNSVITRKDAASLIAESFMGKDADYEGSGLPYWRSLFYPGGSISYCGGSFSELNSKWKIMDTLYNDVEPDFYPWDQTEVGVHIKKANPLFVITNALYRKGILPPPSPAQPVLSPSSKKGMSKVNYPQCLPDSFVPNGPLYAFYAKLWVSLAKSNTEKKYWVK